jgi:membrane protease YdiL (CAAX protease family)
MNGLSGKAVDVPTLVVSAIFLGVVVLAASWGASWAVEHYSAENTPEWMSVFVEYMAMLAVALILVLASSMGDPASFGFVKPRIPGGYGVGITWGLVLGALASITNLAAGGTGMAPLRGLSFLQIVLLVWLLASVAEEVFVRGYIQSYLEPLAARGFKVFRWRISVPVIISALFFSAMHLILLTTGMPFLSVYVILVFTFCLGLAAAMQRERTGSVLPAIATHISFNVGGMIGGMLYVIIQVVLVGRTAAEVTKALTG